MKKKFDHNGKQLIESTPSKKIIAEFYGDRSAFPEYTQQIRRRDRTDAGDFRLFSSSIVVRKQR
jgi:hypothetical protein